MILSFEERGMEWLAGRSALNAAGVLPQQDCASTATTVGSCFRASYRAFQPGDKEIEEPVKAGIQVIWHLEAARHLK